MLEKTKNHIANYNELLKEARADLKKEINNGGGCWTLKNGGMIVFKKH